MWLHILLTRLESNTFTTVKIAGDYIQLGSSRREAAHLQHAVGVSEELCSFPGIGVGKQAEYLAGITLQKPMSETGVRSVLIWSESLSSLHQSLTH